MGLEAYSSEQIGIVGHSEFNVRVFDCRRFYSDGVNGRFELRTYISQGEQDAFSRLHNIGFGVWNESENRVDDKIELKNGDMPRILATIAQIAIDFLKKNPTAYLYAEGSTPSRTRLYQRELRKILCDLPNDLLLMGLLKNDAVGIYSLTAGINFDGFLLAKRHG